MGSPTNGQIQETSGTAQHPVGMGVTFGSRHVFFALSVCLLYVFLNRPEIIAITQLGFSVWYPATRLVLAVLLGVSPWYFF